MRRRSSLLSFATSDPLRGKWVLSCCWSLGSLGAVVIQMTLLKYALSSLRDVWAMALILACWLGGITIAHSLRVCVVGEEETSEVLWGMLFIVLIVFSLVFASRLVQRVPLSALSVLAVSCGLYSTLWLQAPRRRWPTVFEGMVQGTTLLQILLALSFIGVFPSIFIEGVLGLLLMAPLLGVDMLPRSLTCFPDPSILSMLEKEGTTNQFWQDSPSWWSLNETVREARKYVQTRWTGLFIGIVLLSVPLTVFPFFATTHPTLIVSGLLTVQVVSLVPCTLWLRENRAWLGLQDRLIPPPFLRKARATETYATLAVAAGLVLFALPINPPLFAAECIFTSGVFVWARVYPRLNPSVLALALARRQHALRVGTLPPNDDALVRERRAEARGRRCFSLLESCLSIPLVLGVGWCISAKGDAFVLVAAACVLVWIVLVQLLMGRERSVLSFAE